MHFQTKTVLLLFAFFVNLTALAALPILAAESQDHPNQTPYKEAAPIRTFKRITSTDQLISGRRYLIAYSLGETSKDYYVAENISTSAVLPIGSFQVNDQDEIVLHDDRYSFVFRDTFNAGDKGWLIQQQNGQYLKASNDDTEKIYLGDGKTKNHLWDISLSPTRKFYVSNHVIKRYIRYSSNKFRLSKISSSISPNLSLFQEVLDPVTVSISSVGYATLYYGDRALTVPEGVVAKTYAVENGQLVNTKEYVAGDVIPQATAVVLKGKEGTYTFELATREGTAPERSDLYGYDTEQNTSVTNAKYYYKLSLDDDGANVGFYWSQVNGAAFTSGAHKAFLAVKEAIASKAFSFDKEVTAVKSVGLKSADDAVYSLAGLRMLPGHLPAGVYIKNGKKIIVK